MSRPDRLVEVGDVVRVGEPDYIYGYGPLILRVTEVGTIQRDRDEEWVHLKGVQLRADGSPLRPDPRYALVRLAALSSRARPPEAER